MRDRLLQLRVGPQAVGFFEVAERVGEPAGDAGEEYEHGQEMTEVGAVQAAPVSSSSLQYMRVFPVKNKRPLVKGWQASAPIDLDAVAQWEAEAA